MRYLTIILIVAAVLVIPSLAAHAKITDVVEKSFDVSRGGILYIDTDRGSIDITTSIGTTVKVTVTFEMRTNNRDEADEIREDFELELSQHGDDVEIYGDYEK